MLLYITVGIIGGIFSGLLGIGAGTIFIPAMVVLGALPQHTAQGTALAAMIPVVILGFWRYNRQQNIDYRAGLIIICGSFLGVLTGSNLAISLPAQTLEKFFALFLLTVGIRMLYSGIKQ